MEENNQNNTVVETVENKAVEIVEIAPKVETVQNTVVEVVEVKKPYEFRKLNAKDMPLMMKIITKIGLNKFTKLLQNKQLVSLLSGKGLKENEEENEETNPILVGGTIILDAAQIILEGLGDCEEIFELLANVSGKKVEDIEALELNVLMNMIIDFIKKEEFVGFFKDVFELIK